MAENKKPKTHDVFVPLVSFVISNSLPGEIDPVTVKVDQKYPIGDGNIHICRLNSGTSLKELKDFKFENDLLLSDESEKFVLKEMMGSRTNYRFNSGLLLKFTQKSPDQIAIFPNTFENAVRNPVTFLRLFTPGDIFTPYALISGVDVVHLHEFSGGKGHGGDVGYIYQNQVPDFLSFYKNYTLLANDLHKKAKEDQNKIFESWYKRINNAIYFFNQTYFSNESNTYHPEARTGNQLRLIFLCTALDALLGPEYSSKKVLAKNTEKILGKISPKVYNVVFDMYDVRSKFIHADPNKLQSHIKNSDVARLKAIIQKVILVSLELSSDENYIDSLKTQNKKNWFDLLDSEDLEGAVREGVEKVFSFKDNYEVVSPDLFDSLMQIWKSGGRNF